MPEKLPPFHFSYQEPWQPQGAMPRACMAFLLRQPPLTPSRLGYRWHGVQTGRTSVWRPNPSGNTRGLV